MNAELKETTFNKRAGMHTFVVRAYRPKHSLSGKFKFFMRCNGKLYIFCQDGEWRKVVCSNDSLQKWALKVFGIKIGRRGEFQK